MTTELSLVTIARELAIELLLDAQLFTVTFRAGPPPSEEEETLDDNRPLHKIYMLSNSITDALQDAESLAITFCKFNDIYRDPVIVAIDTHTQIPWIGTIARNMQDTYKLCKAFVQRWEDEENTPLPS